MSTIANLGPVSHWPDDLDAQLIAATGCGVREIDVVLAAGADRAAAALRPFLGDEAPPLAAIARAIGDAPDAIDQIRALYAAQAAPEPIKEP